MIKKIKKLETAHFTILLILSSIFGVIYNYIFFSVFNINILKYSSIQDFIFGWLQNIYIICFLSVIFTTLFLLKFLKIDFYFKNLKFITILIITSSFMIVIHFILNTIFRLFSVDEYAKIENYLFFLIIMPFFFIILRLLRIVIYNEKEICNNTSKRILQKRKPSVFKEYLLHLEIIKLNDKRKKLIIKLLPTIKKLNIFVLISSLLSFCTISFDQAQLLKSSQDYINVTANSKEFNNVIHLGTNSNFTFLYDHKKKSTIIVSNSNIVYLKK